MKLIFCSRAACFGIAVLFTAPLLFAQQSEQPPAQVRVVPSQKAGNVVVRGASVPTYPPAVTGPTAEANDKRAAPRASKPAPSRLVNQTPPPVAVATPLRETEAVDEGDSQLHFERTVPPVTANVTMGASEEATPALPPIKPIRTGQSGKFRDGVAPPPVPTVATTTHERDKTTAAVPAPSLMQVADRATTREPGKLQPAVAVVPDARPMGRSATPSAATQTPKPAPTTRERATEPEESVIVQAAKRPETVDVTPAPRPARRDIKFSVAPNQTLSSALRAYVIASGKRMQWNTRADFVIDHPYEVAGKEFADTLGTVLSPYGLTATIWDANLVVEIQQRNAEAEK